MQKGYIELQKPPVIVSAASVVGKHEYEGPLGQFFDMHDPDGSFGQKTGNKRKQKCSAKQSI